MGLLCLLLTTLLRQLRQGRCDGIFTEYKRYASSYALLVVTTPVRPVNFVTAASHRGPCPLPVAVDQDDLRKLLLYYIVLAKL